MDNDTIKKFCIELIRADSEKDVISLIKKYGYWDNSKYWRYYGDLETNFSTIGNQQSRPEAALVEKLVNSVDARLLNECLVNGIDPEGSKAPQTIKHAVAQFFDKKADPTSSRAGLISLWPSPFRTEVAKGITLSATGFMPDEGYPCFTISDCGEGQTPESMPNTFLSLTKSNKLRIPFVQGKFNMGGTGVLQFCGKANLQLIVSRRNPNILKNKNQEMSDNQWGFTIVRREDPVGAVRNSIYTYLAPFELDKNPSKGGVLRFSSDSLPIFPEGREAYKRTSEWGTLIKLYEYEVTGFKSHIIRKDGLLSRIDLLLPYLALPIRLFECRRSYRGHEGSFDTNVTGIGIRLEDDKAENLEFEPSSLEIRIRGESMSATIFVFKKGKAETYRRNEGIIFIVNGQTQGNFTTDFFRRKRVGMSYLADSILVIVDCSRVSGRAREDLFMNSRDRLRGGDFREDIEQVLEDILRNHEGLRELRERRRREETELRVEEDKPLEEILETLLKNSPTLANFFLKGAQLPNPFKSISVAGEDKKFTGKTYPTYFKFLNLEYGETLIKECNINIKSRIQFETDTVDDYFSRQVDPGKFKLSNLVGDNKTEVEDYVLNLHSGIASLTLQLPPNCQKGDTINFIARVYDETQIEPFNNHFKILVKGERISHDGGNGRRKQPGGEPGNNRDLPEGLSLPRIIRIREVDWNKQTPPYNKNTALRVKNVGEEEINSKKQEVYDFYINVDNIFLKTELKSKTREPRITEAKFIYGVVLLGLALIKNDTEVNNIPRKENRDYDIEEKNIEDLVEEMTSAAAMVMLPIIDELSQLDREDIQMFVGDGEAT